MRHIFAFDHPHELPRSELAALLGGKGAGLSEMTRTLGLRVPPGFTIATTAYHEFSRIGMAAIREELTAALTQLERNLDRRLGDPVRPLLVSVRSGAAVSMPGMMDTVLNLGLNSATCEGLARSTSVEFTADCYARLIRSFGETVMGVPSAAFTEGARLHGAARVRSWLAEIERQSGEAFIQDPRQQIERAVAAVLRSWDGARAVAYRRREGISNDLGTAVNVQAMVFGNRDPDSGTGVAFTRDPITGENVPYGDYLVGAQGEDVVAGTHATQPLAAMRDASPAVFAELMTVFRRLELHTHDACEIEFTVESGVLWILQTRIAKRSAAAAVRIAVEMASDGDFPLTREQAILRVTPDELRQTLSRSRADASRAAIAKGLPASPGVATGGARFSADDAIAAVDRGEAVILVRTETSPDDVHGMAVAEGILTATGGLASHAAVVARSWNKPAIVGTPGLSVDQRCASLSGISIEDGRVLTIDGSSGEIFLDASAQVHEVPPPEVATLLDWSSVFAGPGAQELDAVSRLERAQQALARAAIRT